MYIVTEGEGLNGRVTPRVEDLSASDPRYPELVGQVKSSRILKRLQSNKLCEALIANEQLVNVLFKLALNHFDAVLCGAAGIASFGSIRNGGDEASGFNT
jgi:hypothetical protein